jgi:very-short-patch-repair endonuclease
VINGGDHWADGRRIPCMSIAPRRPKELQYQMFRGTEAVHDGLVTPAQLRGRAWTHVRSDVFVDSRIEIDHAVRTRAALMALRPGLVAAGPSAAVLLGIDHAVGAADPVHVIAPRGMRLGHRNGLRVHACDVAPTEIETRGGLSCTSPARTAWDVARWAAPVMSVPIIDTMLARQLVTAAMLGEILESYKGARGGKAAVRAFDLADGRAQSRRESILRVRLCLAGLPRPVPQFPITLMTGVTVHPDLAWPEFRVACEYDGRWHADPQQLDLDRKRMNGIVAAGWIVLHVTARRMREDFDGVVAELTSALISRGWRP